MNPSPYKPMAKKDHRRLTCLWPKSFSNLSSIGAGRSSAGFIAASAPLGHHHHHHSHGWWWSRHGGSSRRRPPCQLSLGDRCAVVCHEERLRVSLFGGGVEGFQRSTMGFYGVGVLWWLSVVLRWVVLIFRQMRPFGGRSFPGFGPVSFLFIFFGFISTP